MCGVSTHKIRLQEPHKTKGSRGCSQLQSKQQIRRRAKKKKKKKERKEKKGSEQTKLEKEDEEITC